MSGLQKPFPAYRGDDSYIFVCYSHRDAEFVYQDLAALNDHGVHVWYDEGIGAGSSWRGEIADAIQGASRMLFFISEDSLRSAHCLREVSFALDKDIDVLPVYLQDIALPGELDLALSRVQALHRQSDARYTERLVEALTRSEPSPRSTSVKAERNTRWPFLAISAAVLALAVFGWQQWSGERTVPTPVSGQPSAFDLYLQGLERLERWDFGDNLEQSIVLFREAIAANEGFALAYARLSEALRIQYALGGEDALLDEAITYAEEAVRLDDSLAPVHVALARAHTLQGNNDLAFAAVERALEIDANDPVANQAMASMLARRGRLEEAEAAYRKAVALDPEHIAVLGSFANFLYDQGRFEEAAAQWQTVLRIAPDHYPTLVNLGSVMTEMNRLSESVTLYQQAIDIKPSAMAYNNLGTAYSRAGRFEEALEAYRGGLAIDDSDWLIWGNVAWVQGWIDPEDPEIASSFDRAIELAEAARARDPRDPWSHSDLAGYYAKTGQFELSRQRLDAAVTLAPDSGEILGSAAAALEIMGQREEAVEMARRALESGYSATQLRRLRDLDDLLEDPALADLL